MSICPALTERWLAAQVFRTYNASITLDALLNKESTATTVDEKKAEYDRANKEVSRNLPALTPLMQQFIIEHLSWQPPGCTLSSVK